MRKSPHIRYMTFKRRFYFYIKYLLAGLWLGILLGIVFIWSPRAKAQLIDPSLTANFEKAILKTPQPGQDGEAVREVPTLEEVRAFYKSIFGPKWKIAFSVGENECGHTRKEWPYCINSWGNTPDKGEYSIGIGQISIARQGGKGAKVHWDKIPGDTLDKKQLWLMNWKNNIITMFVVSNGGDNFNPWSAYTNGNYLRTLNSL
jgi:hypothetical protein